jgi:uncharacterized protein
VGITCSSLVGAPQAEVFRWHERPGAIVRLMPPWQHARVEAEASNLRDGRAVVRLPGGLRWVAAHEGYDSPHRFEDRLVSLPFPWRHVHLFEAAGETTTRVTDIVETPLPPRALQAMFAYRHRQLADDMAAQERMAKLTTEPLTVAMTGASGLVGTALSSLLTTAGHRVVRLVRRPPGRPDERQWDPSDPDPAMLESTDAVVHLAGVSIGGRFTASHKQAVRQSRVPPTEKLARCIGRAQGGPKVFVTASAIGFYGAERGPAVVDESSPRGHGFLADVVVDWEQAARVAEDGGARVVMVRTGLVQSARGGVLALLRPLFEAGLGGRLGSGRQWVSWVDIDDLADVYYRALVDRDLAGPLVATAPNPVTNREYTATLARVLCRPAWLPVPELGPRLLLGPDGAHELAFASQRAQPTHLLRAGHQFRRPRLEDCLRHQLGRFRAS